MSAFLPEDTSISADDDNPLNEARAKLLKLTIMPIALGIIEGSECLKDSISIEKLELILSNYVALRNTAEVGMTGKVISYDHAKLIDRHKIAAAFLLSILKTKPLELKNGAQHKTHDTFVANHYLAFKAALQILAIFGMREAVDAKAYAQAKTWIDRIAHPETRDEVDFERHAVLSLYHAEMNGELTFSIIANWLFVIESFHRQVHLIPRFFPGQPRHED